MSVVADETYVDVPGVRRNADGVRRIRDNLARPLQRLDELSAAYDGCWGSDDIGSAFGSKYTPDSTEARKSVGETTEGLGVYADNLVTSAERLKEADERNGASVPTAPEAPPARRKAAPRPAQSRRSRRDAAAVPRLQGRRPDEHTAPSRRIPVSPRNPGVPALPVSPGEAFSERIPVSPQEPGSPRIPVTPHELGSQQNPVTPQNPLTPVTPAAPATPLMPYGDSRREASTPAVFEQAQVPVVPGQPVVPPVPGGPLHVGQPASVLDPVTGLWVQPVWDAHTQTYVPPVWDARTGNYVYPEVPATPATPVVPAAPTLPVGPGTPAV